MNKRLLISLLLLSSLAYAAGDVVTGSTSDPNAGLTPVASPIMTPTDPMAGIYDLGGRKLIDRTVEITGGLQVDKYIEQVGISTPTIPAIGHARVWLSSATHQYCQIFDDGTQACQGSSSNPNNFFPVSLSTSVVYSLPMNNGGIGTVPICRGVDDSTAFTTVDHTNSIGYIMVPSSGCVFNTSVSLTKPLYFPHGSLITVNSGKTLTLSSAPVAGPEAIFAGTVSITQPSVDVLPEWWGAKPSASATTSATADSAAAFQAADTALVNGGTIKAGAGHYRMNSTVTFSNTNLIGSGKWKTVFEPGNGMVYYSTMTMFSWNNHYAHYESFQVNSNVSVSSFTVFLSSNAAGGEHVRDIQVFFVGVGLNMPVNNGAHISDLFFDGCSTCIVTGGNSGMFAGDVYWNDIVLIPYNDAGRMGNAWLIDKNSSAFYISNLTTLGGQTGVWITVTGGGGLTGNDARPSNMLFHRPIINAHAQYGVRIDQGLYTTFDDNPVINGMTFGAAFQVNASTPAFVDGLEIDNALVDGNGGDGINFNSGCNLSVLGGNYFANGVNNAGIHIGSSACGLVKLQDLMAGTTIWSNAANGQKYGVQIDAGALDNKTNPTTSNVFTGRLMMTGLMLGGNVTAPYLDNSTLVAPRKLIANNETDLSPNFLYGNNSTAGVFTSTVAIQNELLQGTTYSIGQTGELARFRRAVDQNLVLTGAQSLSSGGTLFGMNDNNTLAPLQLRGSRFYWAGADGNFGVNAPTPSSLVHISSGQLYVDGTGGNIKALYEVTAASAVFTTSAASAFFSDVGKRSIYGNFVASATATGVSSITVPVSGYSGYVVRVFLNNATGAKASGLMRVNTNTTTNYSYSNQGWLLTVSSGVSCGNTAAHHILLSGVNSVGNGVNMSSTINVDINSVSYFNGTTMYQESTGNSVVNVNNAGAANLTGITSISVWVGLVNSCTAATIPTTGTTGSIWVWGVY